MWICKDPRPKLLYTDLKSTKKIVFIKELNRCELRQRKSMKNCFSVKKTRNQ